MLALQLIIIHTIPTILMTIPSELNPELFNPSSLMSDSNGGAPLHLGVCIPSSLALGPETTLHIWTQTAKLAYRG